MLDNLFGFLRRKTDFFNGASLEKIDAIVSKAIRKQHELHERDLSVKEERRRAEEKKKAKQVRAQPLRSCMLTSCAQEAARKKAVEADVVELSADGSFDAALAPSVPPTAAPVSSAGDHVLTETSTVPMDVGEAKEDEDDKTPPRTLTRLTSFTSLRIGLTVCFACV